MQNQSSNIQRHFKKILISDEDFLELLNAFKFDQKELKLPIFDLPENYEVEDINYNLNFMAIELVVSHSDWPNIPLGHEIPLLGVNRVSFVKNSETKYIRKGT